MAKRIPAVKSLGDILPKGAESGKEFARVMDLLLFHDARKNNRNLTIFDDRAGDYRGLDAFEETADGIIGYQHKFFPSPLSSQHCSEIKKSLLNTVEKFQKVRTIGLIEKEEPQKIKKWILVTADDFVESGAKKTDGDVSWFNSLKKKLKINFEIEHWGHKQILKLFLESPPLGLFYYPELFDDGQTRRKNIQELRFKYNQAFKSQYGKIEFVGMSVYKNEASHGVPIEKIYIPLNVISNDVNENDPQVNRSNPLDFLKRGAQHVLLGDPGSGKSTLLKYLGLYGSLPALQKRSLSKKGQKFKVDQRLPLIVTLRRYADAIKSNDNLSLIEYIRQNIEADFSIEGLSTEFLEYYLETGQGILLFDGLDELPDPDFKVKIRDRIQNLSKSYPGNTILVTSRIFGYQGTFRFDDRAFQHYRLGKLATKEIEQFVRDWYRVRLESKGSRNENLQSLLAILGNDEHQAIRELARNPLLLTIIVLVHRIDAVLPDERVVLYQKCTETLLNTWHTWKFRGQSPLHRARVDRQNRQRMQAIAHWMHRQSGGANKDQQAVVSYQALYQFLCQYIEQEKPINPEYAPEDIAEVFINFIQDRAGLLIEVGDRQFSFVHLTFQEFLTATQIKTLSEKGGVERAWENEMLQHCGDARWHEVFRLLIANYESDESQEYLVDQFLEQPLENENNSLLLGGILLDGIAAAVYNKEVIFDRLLLVASQAEKREILKAVLSLLGMYLHKIPEDQDVIKQRLIQLICSNQDRNERPKLALIGISLGWKIQDLLLDQYAPSEKEEALYNLFFEREKEHNFEPIQKEIAKLEASMLASSASSTSGNIIAASLEGIAVNFGFYFDRLLFSLFSGVGKGPFFYYSKSSLLLTWNHETSGMTSVIGSPFDLDWDRRRALGRGRVLALDRALDRALVRGRGRGLGRTRTLVRARTLGRSLDWGLTMGGDLNMDRALDRALAFSLDLALEEVSIDKSSKNTEFNQSNTRQLEDLDSADHQYLIWQEFLKEPKAVSELSKNICLIFDLKPELPWREAIERKFLPTVPDRIDFMKKSHWQQTYTNIKKGSSEPKDIYAAAWQLLFDVWLWCFEFYKTPEQSPFAEMAALTKHHDAAPLKIAHCLRDLAFGDESRTDDLIQMVKSKDPAFREIFIRCCWLPTPEEEKREAEEREEDRLEEDRREEEMRKVRR